MLNRVLRSILGAVLSASALSGCSPSFSPDTYASNAAQLANKVDQGIVIGVRAINISADATLGTATGGAAGGIAGSQVGGGAGGALGALGGSVAGGMVGNVVAHTAGDTDGFEYIVRKSNGELLSVTQKDVEALPIGAHVLVIEGPQARIVVDYTVPVESLQAHEPNVPPSVAKDVTSVVPPPAGQPKPVTADTPPTAPAQVTTTPLPAQPSTEPATATPPTSAGTEKLPAAPSVTTPPADPVAKPADPPVPPPASTPSVPSPNGS